MKRWMWGLVIALALAAMVGALVAPAAAQRPQRREGRPGRPAGGPRFRSLDNPKFVPATQADFLKDGDRVLGVSGNGIAKAYPVPMVAWHHIIHDQLGEAPILPTW